MNQMEAPPMNRQRQLAIAGQEAVAHLVVLLAAYLAWTLAFRSGSGGMSERLLLLSRRSLVDVVLIGVTFGLVYGVLATLVRSPSIRVWTMRLLSAGFYALLLAQALFNKETGMFFSGQVALYALRNIAGLSEVLAGAAVNISSIVLVAGAFVFLVVPLLLRNLQAWKLVVIPLLAPVLVVLALQVGQSGAPGSGRQMASDSALVSLLQAPYPEQAGGLIPPYPVPQVVPLPPLAESAPNILLVVLESTRAISVPPFDSGSGRRAEMPTLLAMSGESRVFKRAYTTTSHTSKALVGILCGIHPYPEMPIIESREGGIPVQCLPRILAGAGYQTLFIQSATERFENRPGLIRNAGFEHALFKEQIGEGYLGSGYFGLDEAAIPPQVARWWSAAAGSPKFVTVLTSMTHHPYQELGKAPPGEDGAQLDAYLNVLSYTDRMLHKLMEDLQASGEASNTIVIVTGDHGESFGEHGPRQHDSVPFEEVTRVPLLVWDGRGLLPTGEDWGLRQHIDILPTVLGIVAGGRPDSRQAGGLFGPEARSSLITNCWYASACLTKVTPEFKWIYSPASRRLLAFDLEVDPDERDDVSGAKSQSYRQAVAMELLQHQESLRRFYVDRASYQNHAK
jgi:hypothetical protein